MSCKTTVTEEGIKVMVMDRLNEIKSGSKNGMYAYVLYSPIGGHVIEMNSDIAYELDHSVMFRSSLIHGLWNKEQTFEEIEDEIGGKLSDDAKRALLNTNIRGVKVALYWHDKNRENEYIKGIRFKNHVMNNLSEKDKEKVMKILAKYE